MNHSILCKIGIHDWDQYVDVVYKKSNLPSLNSSLLIEYVPVRICKKCMIRYEKYGYWYPYKYTPGSTYHNKWKISNNYTIEEIREMKLRKILNGKMQA